MIKTKIIQVCDKCLRAACYYGEFMCDYSREAGTTYRTTSELRKLKREHSEYWNNKTLEAQYGCIPDYTWPDKGGHHWVKTILVKSDICAICNIVRRADDQNSPCKGRNTITMRENV
jgi:hypothetical protein